MLGVNNLAVPGATDVRMTRGAGAACGVCFSVRGRRAGEEEEAAASTEEEGRRAALGYAQQSLSHFSKRQMASMQACCRSVMRNMVNGG